MPLQITYWSGAAGNVPAAGTDVSSEALTISGTSAQSGAAPTGCSLVSIYATENARFEVGSNPTASATSAYIGSGERIWRTIDPAQKIAGITA